MSEDEEKLVGVGKGFERTRRITGYLVGTLDRFNTAKRSEERDRVKHSIDKEDIKANAKLDNNFSR
ncbi:MAG: hypothetical protein LBK03_00995 [Bacteroidales bacterium]|jgi:hypothetical protein|nr:hypothetical protein [Bacteroidales bacterium]